MTLFLDTEFNGFRGALISIALVSDGGDMFYGVRHLPKRLQPWVNQHVVPHLHQRSESDASLRARLVTFLQAHEGEDIIADWREDFVRLLRLLCLGGGRAYRFELDMKLVKPPELDPETPHNALSDARALRDGFRSSSTSG